MPEPEQGLPQSPSKRRLAKDVGRASLLAPRSSRLAAPPRADRRMPAPLTRRTDNWSADMSTPDKYVTTGAHPDLPLLYGPRFGCQPADSDSDPLHIDLQSRQDRTSGFAVAQSSTRLFLPLSTGQDACSRPLTRSPIPDWISQLRSPPQASPQGPADRQHHLHEPPLFLTRLSLLTKFAARPTRIGLTRPGLLPPRPATPYRPGFRPREHRPERGDGYHCD